MADFEGTKEMNLDENIGLGELGRLRLENRDLQLAREKLFKKLDKKKNELENEKTHTITLRQFIQELNRKVELLERDKERQSMPVIRPLRIDPRPGLTGEVVERLVIEKTGLESNLEKQKTEIETLKSEITSMNTRIVLTDQKLEIARGEIDHFEKLVPELRLQLSRMENECKRMSMFTYSDDKTIETETLKTRIQDLSITNKHYLSQLQKKDLTIAKSTNRFETEKQQILERSRLEIEKLKQNETSLSEQLISANAELEELYRHSQDKKKTDQDILTLSTDNSQLLQQIACLEGDNAKLQDEFDRKPSKQELIAQLDDTQNKVTELLRKCNSLQKTKNEIEDTLQTELKESRDEVILLKTETNQQKETIDEQNEVIETYKQRQISEEEYKASETKDRLMSRYHYSFQSPASLPTHSIGSNTKPPVIEQPWKCLFCGDSYPSERERDIHMTDSCNNAPTRDDQSIVTQHRPPMGRPPMMKAHTFNAPNAPNFHHPMQQQGYLYHMSNRPLFQQQDRHLMRPSSLQTLEGFPRQSHQGAFSSQRTHRPHMARGLSVTQEEASGIPVSKVQSPLNMATEATKVILLWSKERPTLERELTYFDNSQDVVNLIWTDEQLLYQGNGTLAVGKHHGSLLFPSSGDMVQVQPFEVVRKPMGMFQVKLKLNDPQAQENVKVENRDTDQADRNSGQMDILRAEIQELTVNNNNIKSEKEKCKHELAKLDNQIIELMTELSSIRVYGREEEVKLSQEIEELKNEIHTLRTTSGHNSQGAGESNERVGVLEVTIAELKGKETENKLKIKDLRNENDSFEKENSDLKSEKMILKEQNIDLKESNLMYEKQIDELTKQQQQQPDGDANMELTSQLEAAKQQEFNNETEIWELKQEQDTNLILLQQKEETITTTTNELEQTKQNETSLNEQLITANAELEELYRHSQDKKKTDQEILTLSTDNSHLIQQLACLEGDNAKLQEEFDRKPSKQELIAQLDDTQNKVMELLRKCNPLQKTKNEIEDTLQTELKESRDEVFLLKTETNQQKETINTRNEVIETYKQQQISHRYHYPDQGPSSLPTHSIGPITKPPVIEKPWKWTFCGDTYPSERERKIHMTDSCNNAPTRDAYTTHLNMASNATKVILLWSKERPTFERQLTYFDNSQFSSIVLLKWSIEQSLYQGNGTLAVGKHHGSLLFPSSGAMVQVQPFEVVRKLKRMFRVKLKLYDPQAQENVQVENLDTDQDDRNSDQIDTLRAELQEPVTKSLSTLIPQANKAGKSPSNMYFRGVSIHVVKLKVYPNPLECCNKQVICSINECFELGVLMCIKVGLSHLLPKYAGIDLYNPVGNCDGTHKDKRYFDCSPNCGIFVPIGDVYVPVP